MHSFEHYFKELAGRLEGSEPRAPAAWLCRIYAQLCLQRDREADSSAGDRRYRRLEGLVEVLYDYWPEFEALKVAAASGAYTFEDAPDPLKDRASPGLLVLRHRLNQYYLASDCSWRPAREAGDPTAPDSVCVPA